MMSLYHILGTPFGWIMKIIYDLVRNYGVAIILFTLFTKIILFPITYKQMKNTSRMQLIQPKLEKLRKSYKNNPQKLQEEQMKLYQEEHINPMGSCLPMLLQFVILFGVLDVVYRPLTHILKIGSSIINNATTALSGAGMFKSSSLRDELYILSASSNEKYQDIVSNIDGLNINILQDFYDRFQIFGIHLGEQPTIHPDAWTFETVALAAIPIIAGLLQLILTVFSQIQQKRTNPAAAQMKSMNMMMYIMPLFSVWFAYVVPAGVGFYWICSSFFSLIQTIGLNLYFTPERMQVIGEKEKAKMQKKAANGRQSVYQRIMEQQNAQDKQFNSHKNEVESETDGLSRKEKNVYNRKKLDEARQKIADKYGDVSSDNKNVYDDTDNDPKVIEARKRMAEKYGDRYED